MEKQRLLNKLKSSYIIKNIFEYIDSKALLEFKIFFYSKSFQKKLNIKLIDYKEKYLEKIDISQYLYRTI